MEGKKVVVAMFALAILLSAITFTLYLLTRQIEDEDNGGVIVPNAVVVQHERNYGELNLI